MDCLFVCLLAFWGTYHAQQEFLGHGLLFNVRKAFSHGQGNETGFLGGPRHGVRLARARLAVGQDGGVVAVHGGAHQVSDGFVKDVRRGRTGVVDLIQRVGVRPSDNELGLGRLTHRGVSGPFPGHEIGVRRRRNGIGGGGVVGGIGPRTKEIANPRSLGWLHAAA